MSIELNPQGVARYKDLANNPIYYFHALQYTNGELYRAIFGYEKIWDKDYEDKLMLILDYVLNRYDERNEYYFENVTSEISLSLKGLVWKNGVKPKVYFGMKWPVRIPRGFKIMARVNKLDAPFHVDLEFEDGRILTIPYLTYKNLKDRRYLRSKRDENARAKSKQSKSNGASQTKGQCREAGQAEGTSGENSTQKLPHQLHYLRQGFRRTSTLRKARQEV